MGQGKHWINAGQVKRVNWKVHSTVQCVRCAFEQLLRLTGLSSAGLGQYVTGTVTVTVQTKAGECLGTDIWAGRVSVPLRIRLYALFFICSSSCLRVMVIKFVFPSKHQSTNGKVPLNRIQGSRVGEPYSLNQRRSQRTSFHSPESPVSTTYSNNP